MYFELTKYINMLKLSLNNILKLRIIIPNKSNLCFTIRIQESKMRILLYYYF